MEVEAEAEEEEMAAAVVAVANLLNIGSIHVSRRMCFVPFQHRSPAYIDLSPSTPMERRSCQLTRGGLRRCPIPACIACIQESSELDV